MTASTYDIEESLTRRSPISQIATTVFLGIPMTIALVVALVFYCMYECLKFALSPKPRGAQTPISDEQNFTQSLSTFANVHSSGQPMSSQSKPAHNMETAIPAKRSEVSK